MVLPKPRVGESAGFSLLPWQSQEQTIGDPEKIVWSSINHLCAKEVADTVLFNSYGIKIEVCVSSLQTISKYI